MTGLRQRDRDRTLPGLVGEHDLCPPSDEQLAAWIEAALLRGGGPRVAAIEWEHARWKPGTSITCAYRVRFDDGSDEIVALKRYRDGKHRALAERDLADDDGSTAPLRPWALVPEHALALWTLTSDRVLAAGLAPFLDARTLARLFEQSGRVPARSVRRRRIARSLLRYKPERRSVWRVDLHLRDLPDTAFAVRVLPPDEAARTAGVRAELERLAGDLPTSRLVLADARGLVVEEWEDVLPSAANEFDHAPAAGALLAALHAVATPHAVRPTETDRRDPLLPLFDVDPRLPKLERRIGEPTGTSAPRWAHGDFHPDQVVRDRTGGTWRVFDLDALGVGDASRDLASWIADCLVERESTGYEEASGPLLEGYSRAGGTLSATDRRRLPELVADELVRRAAAFVRRLEADAVPKARAALELAVSLTRRADRTGAARAHDALEEALRDLERTTDDARIREGVRRGDAETSGAVVLEVEEEQRVRWFRHDGRSLRELFPQYDAAIPLTRRLARGPATWRTLAYRPGRRLVVEERGAEGTLITKGFRRGRAERAAWTASIAEEAARAAGLVTATLASFHAEDASLSYLPLHGTPIDVKRSSSDDFARLGRGLRALQRHPAPAELAAHDGEAELAVLDAWAAKVERTTGSLPARWRVGRTEARSAMECVPTAPLVLSHRDLHDGQLLRLREGVAVLDFDLLCRADAAVDAGNLAAHLELRALQGLRGASPEDAAACRRAFLEAFDPDGDAELGERIRFYEGTTLLRLALVYALRPRWTALTDRLVHMANQRFERTSRGVRT